MQKAQYKIVLTQSEKEASKQVGEKQILQQDSILEELKLQIGSSFWSIEQDFEAIYENFNLLSYFSNSCQIEILDRVVAKQHQNFVSYDSFTIGNNTLQLLMIEKTKDKLDPSSLPNLQKSLRRDYVVARAHDKQNKIEVDKAEKLAEIVVEFNTQIQKVDSSSTYLLHVVKEGDKKKIQMSQQRQLIIITIIDKGQWISQNFDQMNFKEHNHRISDIRKASIHETEYFYKEPKNQRNKVISGDHFSLALQGGGCKGVLYIGAYKAILNSGKDAKITSVIGSSAGGIIGLAVCCQLDPQQIVEVCQKKLSKITEDQKYKTIKEDKSNIMGKTYDDLFGLLSDLNIFDSNIISMLKQFISDKRTGKLLLQLINVAMNPEVKRLFVDESEPEKLNLVGLLKATLMTGEKVSQIGVDCITYFLEKKLRQKNPAFMAKYPTATEASLRSIAEKITMIQLYELTGVQFTCTAVDLNSKILRFFNQKTTPGLPACKAVQMTGSFPVAFEAQRWKKEWGKYYVHYQNFRREIDITQHCFTDGGTLSNFPIKYLDNEDMRPMYFSHVQTARTSMYGVGLITDIEEDPTKAAKIGDIVKKLGDVFKEKIGYMSSLWSWFKEKFGSKPSTKITPLTQGTFSRLANIPLVKFGIDLLMTYSKTKDNLSQECFSHQCYQTYFDKSAKNWIQNKPDNKTLSEKNKIIVKQIKEILNQISQNDPNKIYETFKAKLKLLSDKDGRLNNEQTFCEITSIVYSNSHTLLYLLTEDASKQIKVSILSKLSEKANQILKLDSNAHNVIAKLNLIKQNILAQKIFVLSELDSDRKLIKKVCDTIQAFCDDLLDEKQNQTLSKLFKEALSQALRIQKKYIQQLVIQLEKGESFQNKFSSKVMYLLQKLSHMTLTTSLLNLKKVADLIKHSQIPQYFIQFQTLTHRNTISSYVTNRINKQQNRLKAINLPEQNYQYRQSSSSKIDGIHIVLESVELSELYFHYYYKIVRQTLFQYNQKLAKQNLSKFPYLNVSTLTATGYHCLGIFLHASDLPQHRIQQQMWKIRDLIKVNKADIESKYNNADWVKLTPILLKEVQQQAILKKKDIFSFVQEHINRSRSQRQNDISKLVQNINSSMESINLSNQEMIEAIEASLNYVVNLLVELEQSKGRNYDKDISNIISKLVLNNAPQFRSDKVKKYSQNLKNMMKFFSGKYKDILHYLSYQSPFVVDQIVKMLKPEDRLVAWKGVILSQILEGNQIKAFVIRILKQLDLKTNTTLKQFYDFSQKKIQLNFSVVEESVVSIFNHKTRPNMPIWAAILAASSTPSFFSPVLDRPEWMYNIPKDHKIRKINSYFSNVCSPYKRLSSSEALTRMPLDLLQNYQFQSRITNLHNQVFLVFNFTEFKLPNIGRQLVKQLKITQLTIGQVVTNFVSFASAIFGTQSTEGNNIEGLKMVASIPTLQSKVNLLNLYIGSHDKLIMQLYKRELAHIPVRLDTLDFHLMTVKQQDTQRLSNICEDAIMQAQFIIKQKLQNKYSDSLVGAFHKQNIHTFGISMINKADQNLIGGQIFKHHHQGLSNRLLYFRVQSQQISKQTLDKLKQQISSQPQNALSILEKNNRLKFRLLSILNPSRAQYEQSYFYYKKQNSSELPYNKLKTESFVLEHTPNDKLYVKIQYCSSDKIFVKCSYYQLDLADLFKLSLATLKRSLQNQDLKQIQFGFVYRIQFDTIYSQFNKSLNLVPASGYKQDYMNRNNPDLIPVNIKIISDIKDTIYESVACSKCVYPFRLQRRKKQSNFQDHQTYLSCDICKTRSLLRDRFKIEYDSEQNRLKCLLNHPVKKMKATSDDFQIIRCDFCGRASMNEHWVDFQCKVIVCDCCRSQSMQF